MSGKEKLKVLMVATEVAPYIKSGGLGDVAGSLPKELVRHDADIRIVFPKYKDIDYTHIDELTYKTSITVSLGWRRQEAKIYEFDDGVKHYVIGNDHYFGRSGLYGYGDDYERFAFFTKASIEFLYAIDFKPDIIHFNDWQTGLGPIYLNDVYKSFSFYDNIKSLYTIHNLQYQGTYNGTILGDVGLNGGYFVPDKLEYYGDVSLMKGGIVYASAVSTVSQTYAGEIQTPMYAYGMDGVLRSRVHNLHGIINGIDYVANDPKTDKRIAKNFSPDTIENKLVNKRDLQKRLGLSEVDVPLIGIISRMVDQKGFDLIAIAMEELMNKDIQMVVLGSGDSRYENMFKHYAWRYPNKLSANIMFDTKLAQQIYAGSDMFLMPSLFEPCGLGQMFAMRYGSVPIVRRTGGLADTVSTYDASTGGGNGFVFNDYDAYGMMWAINEAIRTYFDTPKHWGKIVKNAMESDFSWDRSAAEYIALYKSICGIDS